MKHDFSHGKGKCGIYAIRNTINGKVYVGSALDIRTRWYSHRCCLNKGTHGNQHLQWAWKKYGAEAFCFDVLEEESDPDQLLLREAHWIDELDALTDGYNIATEPFRAEPRFLSIEINGRIQSLAAWCREYGIEGGLASARHHKLGCTWEEAITIPVGGLYNFRKRAECKRCGLIFACNNILATYCRMCKRAVNKEAQRAKMGFIKFYQRHIITLGGETKSLEIWCDQYGIERKQAWQRHQRGWTWEEAITLPKKIKGWRQKEA